MNLATKRFGLVLAGVVGVGAIAAMAMGASFALFTSSATGISDTVTAGTVTLSNSASTSCTFTNIAPGDAPTTCQYKVDYTGSLTAWMLLSASITSTTGLSASPSVPVGTSDLYDGTTTGLQVAIVGDSSEGARFSNPGQSFSPTGTNQVVYPLARCVNCTGVEFQPNTTETFTLYAALPSWAGDVYQGGSATITLTASAVQYPNNNGNDCYLGPCSIPGTTGPDPFIVGASAVSASPAITLTYNEDVTWGGSNLLNPADFTVTDLTQSGASPVTCPVITSPGGNGDGTSTIGLPLGTCSNGKAVNSGDYLDFSYNSGAGSSSPYIHATASDANPTGIQSSQSISLISVS
ncbi:MAG TPA: hypothetical protein VMW80_01070 [Candidatus Dormibacteraeota bacterium]|nr:hypothetical protein [Candidatus Dormibacteraeota bacterium]